MTTHNLDDPKIFIAPSYHTDKFIYRMFHTSAQENEILVRTINLRSDKLIIYGTELDESALDRLHQSLILVPGTGAVRVNCYGALYFVVPGKVRYRPIHNVIFDWSQFGVIVPNSINDSLRKKLEEKEKEIDKITHQLSSIEAEVLSTKDALEASQKEKEELKEQLSSYRESYLAKEDEVREVREEISSVNLELYSTRSQLESSKERVKDLEEQLSGCKKEVEETKEKLNHSGRSENTQSLLPLRENNFSRRFLVDHKFPNSESNLAMSIAIEEDIPVK